MAWLVGTDEAGYGPNLGPLVISTTVWSVPDEALDGDGCDLYRLLRRWITAQPVTEPRRARGRVVMADSKALYSTATGIGLLERGLLTALATMDHRPTCWSEVWSLLCPSASESLSAAPWYLGYDDRLPLVVELDDLERAADRLRAGLESAGVRLALIRSRAVFPDEWNPLVEQLGNKSTALSHLTLELLAAALAGLPDGRVSVVCDKHGGRNHYAGVLQHFFADDFVEVHRESREASVYRFGPEHRRTHVLFRPEGECFLPTALASMTSKYLRELAMRAFNAFWCRHLPELRPTAGYSQDARRFKRDIGVKQQALGIDDRHLWRDR